MPITLRQSVLRTGMREDGQVDNIRQREITYWWCDVCNNLWSWHDIIIVLFPPHTYTNIDAVQIDGWRWKAGVESLGALSKSRQQLPPLGFCCLRFRSVHHCSCNIIEFTTLEASSEQYVAWVVNKVELYLLYTGIYHQRHHQNYSYRIIEPELYQPEL